MTAVMHAQRPRTIPRMPQPSLPSVAERVETARQLVDAGQGRWTAREKLGFPSNTELQAFLEAQGHRTLYRRLGSNESMPGTPAAMARLNGIQFLFNKGHGVEQICQAGEFESWQSLAVFLRRVRRVDLLREIADIDGDRAAGGTAARLEAIESQIYGGAGRGLAAARTGFSNWPELRAYLRKHQREGVLGRVAHNNWRNERKAAQEQLAATVAVQEGGKA